MRVGGFHSKGEEGLNPIFQKEYKDVILLMKPSYGQSFLKDLIL